MGRSLKKGDGWRIGWDADSHRSFQGLLGTDDWAVELTAMEFADFCRLLVQLVASLEAIAPELMVEERITLEAESETIWLELDGFPSAYSLRLILLNQRNVEGTWATAATAALARQAEIFQLQGELAL